MVHGNVQKQQKGVGTTSPVGNANNGRQQLHWFHVYSDTFCSATAHKSVFLYQQKLFSWVNIKLI